MDSARFFFLRFQPLFKGDIPKLASGEAKFQCFFRGLVQHRKMRVPPKPRGLRSRRWGQSQLIATYGQPKVPEWSVYSFDQRLYMV